MKDLFPGIGKIFLLSVILLSIIAIRYFKPRTFQLWGARRAFHILKKYRWYMLLFGIVWIVKGFIDKLNDPIRGDLDLNFTNVIHWIEGDTVYYIQKFFLNDYLTLSMTLVYILGYMFINYFSVLYFAHLDDQDLADKLAMNYTVLYLMSIPFYLFFPVDVTGNYISGMDTIAYNMGPSWHLFFVGVDPFDNAMPSLHIGIPFAMVVLMWRSQKRRGIDDYNRYLYFVTILLFLFVFAVLYLGIHWITDIFCGIGIGLVGVYIVEGISMGFWDWINASEWRFRLWLARKRGRPRPTPEPFDRSSWKRPLWKEPKDVQDRYFAKEMEISLEELERYDKEIEGKMKLL